jgi:hypothetical protein
MKREEVYCDVCEKKMSYQDSDGESEVQGITIDNQLVLSIDAKTGSGSSSRKVHGYGLHFCGPVCFNKRHDSIRESIIAIATQEGLT